MLVPVEIPFTMVKKLVSEDIVRGLKLDSRTYAFLERHGFPAKVIIAHPLGMTAVDILYDRYSASLEENQWGNLISRCRVKVNHTCILIDNTGSDERDAFDQYTAGYLRDIVIGNDIAGELDIMSDLRMRLKVFRLLKGKENRVV